MRLLLFDIDGTLLRLRGGIGRRMFIDAFESTLSVNVAPALENMSFAGRTDRHLVTDISDRMGLDPVVTATAWPSIRDTMMSRAQCLIVPDAVEILPGVHDLLKNLSREAVTLGLVTGNIRSIAFRKLQAAGLDSYFTEGAFGCEDPDRNQLPPRAVTRLNSLNGTTYAHSDAVIIGDAPQDIECAKHNGIRSIGVATGQHSSRELSACGADAVLESFRDVSHSSVTILA
ncbi:MAG: HAD hydrolase-like protein [bacterium]|nr:HAD hydrolase-like protein [bacterium]